MTINAPILQMSCQQTLEHMRCSEHAQCLMCGKESSLGMKLNFRVQNDGSVVAMFPCHKVFQSYPETLHGGMISALLDSAMTNALFAIGVVAVTVELSVRFLMPVVCDCGAVVKAFVENNSFYPLFYTKAELKQKEQLMAYASAKFLVKGETY